MRNYLASFCAELGFPPPATEAMLAASNAIEANAAAREIFHGSIALYSRDALTDYKAAQRQAGEAAALAGVAVHTAELLLYLYLSRHTRELYRQKGLPLQVFYDSMADLKWKLLECHARYGIWGTFVGHWFPRFFQLTRFTLGRLQFEAVSCTFDYASGPCPLHNGDTVLNVHIPSAGPLRQEDCHAAYRQAQQFYRTHFGLFSDRPAVFQCGSWMLFPALKALLPPESGIVRFMDDYSIVSVTPDPAFNDAWRIFNCAYEGNPASLPRKTSLQRAIADYLADGNTMGSALGVFFLSEN